MGRHPNVLALSLAKHPGSFDWFNRLLVCRPQVEALPDVVLLILLLITALNFVMHEPRVERELSHLTSLALLATDCSSGSNARPKLLAAYSFCLQVGCVYSSWNNYSSCTRLRSNIQSARALLFWKPTTSFQALSLGIQRDQPRRSSRST